MSNLNAEQQKLVEQAYSEVSGLDAIRAAGRVLRYHQHGPDLAQRVDAHSWGVATLVLYLWPDASRDLVVAALRHDVGEFYTGDVSATTKWMLSQNAQHELNGLEEKGQDLALSPMPSLNLMEERQLKLADQLELMLHCLERMRAGDRAQAPGPFWRVARVVDAQLCRAQATHINLLLPDALIQAQALLGRLVREAECLAT